MDMFNKLKSSFTPLSQTVSSALQDTVYNTGQLINGVIPGNPVTREYEIKEKTGSAGPSLLWVIYSAVKKSSGQPASVWVLTRLSLDKYDRQDREIIWELMKRGVSQLTRLRHPSILTVEHPLEESRDCLAFATEPVLASLSNLIVQENISSSVPSQILNYKLEPLEIKYGLLQVAEGLAFLHTSARLLHRNLCLESIIVNSQGAWKISGFEYSLTGKIGEPGPLSWDPPEYDQSQPAESYPHLDYSAPELALQSGSVAPSADMFSFGMIAYTVHNKKTLYQTNRNWSAYKRCALDLRSIPDSKLTSVPKELVESVLMLVSRSAQLRPTPEEIQQLQYFQDVGVKTLQKLDSQFQLDNVQKSQFFKSLLSVLPHLPTRVLVNRVYPCLAKEFINATMVPFLLPAVFHIIERSTQEEFMANILSSLKPVMKMMEPVQILLIFMQNMKCLLDKTPVDALSSDVLPMLYRALDAGVEPQIQELCLTILPQFSDRLDNSVLRSGLMPRIRSLCSGTRLLSVRVNCLVCVGRILEHMDKWQVVDEVVPMVTQLPSREPAIVMATVGIFKVAMNNPKLGLSKEVMANKILPFLFPVLIENSLSLAQFESVAELIKDMTNKVEKDQRSRLQQMKVSKDQDLATNDSSHIFKSSSTQSFAGFADTQKVTESSKSIALSTSTSSLSLEDKQRLFRGQEAKSKDLTFGGFHDSSNKNSTLQPSTGSGSKQIPGGNITAHGPSATTNNTFVTSPSPIVGSMAPFTSPMPNNNSKSTSFQDMNTKSKSNYNVNSLNASSSNFAFQNSSMNMNNMTKQPNFSLTNFSGFPTSDSQPIANGFKGVGPPAGGAMLMLKPSNNQIGSNNNSNSTKNLSLAEINDFLS